MNLTDVIKIEDNMKLLTLEEESIKTWEVIDIDDYMLEIVEK